MQVSFTFDLADPAAQAMWQQLVKFAQGAAENAVAVDAQPETPADVDAAMKVNRQAAAATARAAKAAKAATKPGPVEQVLGPNGSDQPEDDDMGLTDPNMSPAEAKEAGLALVREVYAAGKVQQVKALQKEWQVAKFYDVPQEQGHAFYQRVVKMAVETGVRK